MPATQNSTGLLQTIHTEREWQRKFFGMGAKCYYCEIPLLLKEAQKEHRIPRCRGGSSDIRNLVPACKRCNQMKAWRTEAEFVEARPGLCRESQASRAKNKPNPVMAFEERMLEPGLLRKLLDERDNISWWRTA